MKEDYLWDKTGEDAEIERLENALKAFRYTEIAPPELPQKVFAVEKNPRRFFRFGFAFAAFASFIIVFSVVWLQSNKREISVKESVAAINLPKNEVKVTDEPNDKTPKISLFKITQNQSRFVKPNVIKPRRNIAPEIRPAKTVLRTIKRKQPTETLTAEEKYAYDQLMLALSVTSSSLKIVKEKVEGIEDKTAVLDAAK